MDKVNLSHFVLIPIVITVYFTLLYSFKVDKSKMYMNSAALYVYIHFSILYLISDCALCCNH